jgi:sugar lactone lactonase YvrE
LPFSGVYVLSGDRLKLVSTDLMQPNGLALSPDEQHLYVGSSGRDAIVMRHVVQPDGTLTQGEIFLHGQAVGGAKWFDGMKVDVRGNLYVTSSVGVIIVDATGAHLGTIRWSARPTNVAWGESDAQTLYITAPKSLHRIRLGVRGYRMN